MDTTLVTADDMFDIVCLCHAALAQDSPMSKTEYINQILNISFGYISSQDRKDLEVYLAEKKYLPDVDIKIVK